MTVRIGLQSVPMLSIQHKCSFGFIECIAIFRSDVSKRVVLEIIKICRQDIFKNAIDLF